MVFPRLTPTGLYADYMRTSILSLVCVCVWVAFALSVGRAQQGETLCAEAMTTVAMQQCLTQRYQALDSELNRVYRQLLAQLSPVRQSKLREAQRAWLRFRDTQAEFVASAEAGGSMYALEYLVALTSMTASRVGTLQEIVNREGEK